MAPYRVLVVDDSPFMRKIFSDLIVQDPQFTIVATACNGIEAIEAVKKWKPDAVTLDLEMPELNGLDALQRIMIEQPTPVIMLSGISEENTRETIKALQLGAFDFIRKPMGAFSNDIVRVGELLLEKLRIAVLTKRYSTAVMDTDKKKASINRDMPEQSRVAQPVKSAEEGNNRKRGLLQPEQQAEARDASAPALEKKTKPTGGLRNPVKPLTDGGSRPYGSAPGIPIAPVAAALEENKERKRFRHTDGFDQLIAIGTSTGGPRALHEVITSLPAQLAAPVLIVQHMPPKFTKSLAQRLDSFSELEVVEASQGDRLKAGVVYIAPGGHHMELAKDQSGYYVQLTQKPPRNGHRPSVDVLFESLTPFDELKRHAVIMTGMGSDGAKGMKALVDSGAESAIAESEQTCVVYGMPRSAIETGCVKTVLPLQQIAAELQHAVLKG
ncbi:chemotaxis response regulator protein-glutamate methylesterase of group 1 operon [Paenibacillus glycanilyticus]|uniref:Protein-glutamate methylesterase/protein-glutamine glutaminase n=1 Tax=Paenibacillus glycanilyticus TaxID=126569 RepID=A0ABQ6NSJ1_9BACL|nr:chemotaxis response regulator protein-glutamate methylesterase [Paenibacillus glycanilyticus]GMK48065.1 chemotaxis response regulator protein-glutamate methylesterase of group 1 operon [Paenibacillus glycanilyticus]